MNNDRYQDKYNEVFQELKEEKMNWDFDDFLQRAEDKTASVPLEIKTQPKLPTWFWMAAGFVLLFSVGGFLVVDNWKDKEAQLQAEILKQKDHFLEENNQEHKRVAFNSVEDSLKSGVKDSVFADSAYYSERDIMDDILPRKGRFKKKYKEVFVMNEASESENITMKDSAKYNAEFVIVNGKKIEDMQEAIDVTKFSFQVLSKNVNSALAQTQTSEDDY